jgi:hypothetical protein
MTPVGTGRGGLVKANATQVSTPGTSTNTTVLYIERSDTNGLCDEQWQTLLNILNNTKIEATEKLTSKCSSIQWIIDTGTSHHMTGRLDC